MAKEVRGSGSYLTGKGGSGYVPETVYEADAAGRLWVEVTPKKARATIPKVWGWFFSKTPERS